MEHSQGLAYLNRMQSELAQYFRTMNATPPEKKAVRAWVRKGNSFYDNPYLIYGEDGWPMDFISARRFEEEMLTAIPDGGDVQMEFDSPEDLPF